MAEKKQVEITTSVEILREINRVLQYNKIRRILQHSGTNATAVMATIIRLSSMVDVKTRVDVITEDPSDNHVLACTKEAGAHFIVSGDRHLLRLGEFGKTRIVTASEFSELRRIRKT